MQCWLEVFHFYEILKLLNTRWLTSNIHCHRVNNVVHRIISPYMRMSSIVLSPSLCGCGSSYYRPLYADVVHRIIPLVCGCGPCYSECTEVRIVNRRQVDVYLSRALYLRYFDNFLFFPARVPPFYRWCDWIGLPHPSQFVKMRNPLVMILAVSCVICTLILMAKARTHERKLSLEVVFAS